MLDKSVIGQPLTFHIKGSPLTKQSIQVEHISFPKGKNEKNTQPLLKDVFNNYYLQH
jgi:hypothetical protein